MVGFRFADTREWAGWCAFGPFQAGPTSVRLEANERASRCRRTRTAARNAGAVAWRRAEGVAVRPPERGGQEKASAVHPPAFPCPVLAWPRRGAVLSPAASAFHVPCAQIFSSPNPTARVPTRSTTDSARHRTNRKERHGKVG